MIKKYEDKYFKEINRITEEYWSNEVPMSTELTHFIYEFLVKYYLSNYELSLVDTDNTMVFAFILASLKSDSNESMTFFNQELKRLNDEDKAKAYKYLEYLNYNHKLVESYMDDNDVYLALIASQKRNSGSRLINELIKISQNKGYKSIYLWTDETCNYRYYEKKGFTLVKEYSVNLYNRTINTFIYKKNI